MSKRVENTAGKGEIARYEQFLLFPLCFQRTCTTDTSKSGLAWERVKKQNILALYAVKAFINDSISQAQIVHFFLDRVGSILGKGENMVTCIFLFSHSVFQ